MFLKPKYRSAIYTFTSKQADTANQNLQNEFTEPIITKALSFQTFPLNEENYLDYYDKDPSKPFCQNIVNSKLKELTKRFAGHLSASAKTS